MSLNQLTELYHAYQKQLEDTDVKVGSKYKTLFTIGHNIALAQDAIIQDQDRRIKNLENILMVLKETFEQVGN